MLLKAAMSRSEDLTILCISGSAIFERFAGLANLLSRARLKPDISQLMRYLPPAQSSSRWFTLVSQLLGLVLFAFVLITALPFLLVLAGIGAVVLFFSLRQVRRELENNPLTQSFPVEEPIDITPWHQRVIKDLTQRRR